MIRHKIGDILQDDAEALVNTVNCVGVMGRGIALQFKKQWPDNFKHYVASCDRKEVQPGKMLVFETGKLMPRFIINFPTKRHWKGKSHLEDIDSGLMALVNEIQSREIRSIAIPPLGAGNGGLDWNVVRPRILQALQLIPGLDVRLYEPVWSPEPESEPVKTHERINMTQGRASLILLIDRYASVLLDPFITVLEVQKLLYFMQIAGEPLKLRFEKNKYGPYSDQIRHVLAKMNGQLITGFNSNSNNPYDYIRIVSSTVPEAEMMMQKNPDTKSRFERVVSLVEGFESAFGLELLATVHWVVMEHGVDTPLDRIVGLVHKWGKNKTQFTPRHIEIAWQVLHKHGWFNKVEA